MSGAGDAEQHLHDPPPPAGHYLDRWGFVCEGTSAPPVSKEEAALEARRVFALGGRTRNHVLVLPCCNAVTTQLFLSPPLCDAAA